MEEQSDTPRVDAVLRSFRFIAHTDRAAAMWLDTVINIARDIERELATATRERDEARALNAQWAEKAATWTASPEAAQRLQGYRDLAQQVAAAQNERDEARAEVERMRSAFVHCHVRGSSGDLCAVCGLDLRDKVHTAATEAKPWAR